VLSDVHPLIGEKQAGPSRIPSFLNEPEFGAFWHCLARLKALRDLFPLLL
jgi:hypothetical protein